MPPFSQPARRRALSFGITATLATLILSGCVHYHHHGHPRRTAEVRRPGPPPWAPAHGHRHKHSDGVELVFDSGLGVYVVLGHPGYYWHGDHYYRYVEGKWEVSVTLSKGWRGAKIDKLPPGLRKKDGRADGRKPGKKKGAPAKHGY